MTRKELIDRAREIEIIMINKLQSGTYGGFAASLGKAYELADLDNRLKLKKAFRDIFDMAHNAALLELPQEVLDFLGY